MCVVECACGRYTKDSGVKQGFLFCGFEHGEANTREERILPYNCLLIVSWFPSPALQSRYRDATSSQCSFRFASLSPTKKGPPPCSVLRLLKTLSFYLARHAPAHQSPTTPRSGPENPATGHLWQFCTIFPRSVLCNGAFLWTNHVL